MILRRVQMQKIEIEKISIVRCKRSKSSNFWHADFFYDNLFGLQQPNKQKSIFFSCMFQSKCVQCHLLRILMLLYYFIFQFRYEARTPHNSYNKEGWFFVCVETLKRNIKTNDTIESK